MGVNIDREFFREHVDDFRQEVSRAPLVTSEQHDTLSRVFSSTNALPTRQRSTQSRIDVGLSAKRARLAKDEDRLHEDMRRFVRRLEWRPRVPLVQCAVQIDRRRRSRQTGGAP